MKKLIKIFLASCLLLYAFSVQSQGIQQKLGPAFADNLDSLFNHNGTQMQPVFVLGRSSANDGLGAWYVYDSTSTATPIPYQIFAVTGRATGRWILIQLISSGGGDSTVFNSPDYAVIDILTTPPGSPTDQDKYLAGVGSAGAWIGQDNDIETWDAGGSAWTPTVPTIGQLLIRGTDDHMWKFTASGWIDITSTLPIHKGGDNYGPSNLYVGNKANKAFGFLTNNILRGKFSNAGNFFLYYLGNGNASTDSILVVHNGEVRRVAPNSYIIDTTALHAQIVQLRSQQSTNTTNIATNTTNISKNTDSITAHNTRIINEAIARDNADIKTLGVTGTTTKTITLTKGDASTITGTFTDNDGGGGGGGTALANFYLKDSALSSNRSVNNNHLNLKFDTAKNFTINQYIDTIANTNTALGAGYGVIPTSGTDFTQQNAYILNLANDTRIRQSGTITTLQFYLNTKPTSTLAFVIWRKSGSNYTIVSTQDILSLTTATSTNTITLPTPVNVLEGDFTGFSYTSSSSISVFKTVNIGASIKYFTSDPGSSSDFTSATSFNNYIPVLCTVSKSPVLVSTGNSIVASNPNGDSYISITSASLWDTSGFPYKVQAHFGIVGQNTGIGGNTTAQILARFPTDVLALHPKYVLIDGGVNDIRTDLPSQAAVANWISMLQKCKDSSIRPIMMLILPWTNGTNAQNTSVDSINTVLQSLAPTYNAILVDARSTVGQFRSGGTAGNFWDIQTVYSAGDGIHFNGAANTAIANLIDLAMLAAQRTSFRIDSTGRTIVGGALNVNNSDGNAGNYLVSNGAAKPPTWSTSVPWVSIGNLGTHDTSTFVGTTDNTSLFFKTLGTTRVKIDSVGNIGIGTIAPSNKLSIIASNPLYLSGLSAATLTSDSLLFVSAGVVKKSPSATYQYWTLTGSDIYRNSKVAIGSTSAPGAQLEVTTSSATTGINIINSTAANFAELKMSNSAGNFLQIFKTGTSYAGYRNIAALDQGFYSQTGNFSFLNDNGTGNFSFAIASATPIQTIKSTGVAIGTTTSTAKLQIGPGGLAANTAQIELENGTGLTTPQAGTLNRVDPQLQYTNGGGQVQELFEGQQSRVSTQFDATSNTTLANITGLTATLVAGKIYRFEAILYTTSNVAGGVKFAIAGTATATNIIYEDLVTDANVNAAQTRGTALATAVGGVTAVTNAYSKITGTITVNAAGTLTVQFAQNASNGTASSVLVGSTFVVTQMP